MHNLIRRLFNLHPHEVPALLWSFLYFFCLLCAYYVIRPLRDEMGIAGGVQNLPWVFTGTFIAMLCAVPLFGAVTARLPRRQFMPLVYYFFIANIAIFFLLFHAGLDRAIVARGFFIWTSVFNLFVVSVFWSFMSDLFTNEQARRLFGVIAAGGSAGALTGPAVTALSASELGPVNLLPVSAALLAVATLCIHRLHRWSVLHGARESIEHAAGAATLGGSIFAGVRLVFGSPYLLGVCAFILLYTSLSTFLYFEQAHIVRDAFSDPGQRTRVFAGIDFAVNALTILTQAFVTGRLMSRLPLAWALALIPVAVAAGFLILGVWPTLAVLVVFQVIRRAGNYAITRPAREVLFTVVGRETRYKAKNFIDTVVYRGGDAVAGWVFDGLKTIGLTLAGIAYIAVPLALVWAGVGVALGRRQEVLRVNTRQETAERRMER